MTLTFVEFLYGDEVNFPDDLDRATVVENDELDFSNYSNCQIKLSAARGYAYV